jgi:hypothetical protein
VSGAVSKQQVEKRSKAAIWFNNLFRTKLEIESDKLLEMMQHSNENQIKSSAQYYYQRGKLEEGVAAKLKAPPTYIKLTSLTVAYWCDVPKGLWEKFSEDSVFSSQLHDHVNQLTERLVGEWAKRQIHWERLAAEADKNGDKEGVENAKAEFAKDCETLRKECETVAVEDIAEFFTAKAATFGDYKRYKFKAGAKLTFTFVGIIISVAALSSAASPAAPATLVPALIGIVAAVASAGKQIKDLAASAEEVEAELKKGVAGIKATYLDENKKAKKKTFAAKDFTSGFAGGLTGGWSEVVFPSINSLMSVTDTHKSKLDGLDVVLNNMGTNLNALVTSLDAADKVLADNKAALDAARKNPGKDFNKIEEGVVKSKTAFLTVKQDFYKMFDKEIPAMIKRIEDGRKSNEEFKTALEAINDAVGSKNWGVAGNAFATIALVAIGFSSGGPANLAEKVTIGMGPAWTVLDQLREYSPEVMKEALGKKDA